MRSFYINWNIPVVTYAGIRQHIIFISMLAVLVIEIRAEKEAGVVLHYQE